MCAEEVDRYTKNSEVAKKVGLHFFMARLHAFDSGWRFRTPKWLSAGTTFNIPDYVMGLLAERIGLEWEWDRHPIKAIYESMEYQENKIEQLKDFNGAVFKVWDNKHDDHWDDDNIIEED